MAALSRARKALSQDLRAPGSPGTPGRNRERGGCAVNLSTSTALVHSVLTAERDYAGLYQRVGPGLWRAIYAYSGGQRDVADDAVAEAFARAIQHDGVIRRPQSWLYRTAFRMAAAEVRRRRLQTEIGEYAYEQTQDVAEVLMALRKLTPSQRAAVYLHYQADLPIREIARLMGTSVAAVKVHLHRGRRRLRGLLGTEETSDA
ncbi:MAG TPA: sigma-70 family RNA polymerase sigma factor [Actinomycetota bacterium]|nr:sigma-70 family RNA polymerase sigma factor [Actinomycetota bacterium]